MNVYDVLEKNLLEQINNWFYDRSDIIKKPKIELRNDKDRKMFFFKFVFGKYEIDMCMSYQELNNIYAYSKIDNFIDMYLKNIMDISMQYNKSNNNIIDVNGEIVE
jgi:hypothetical protein